MELQRSEARCKQLAETTFEGIAISEKGAIVDGNSQLKDLFGFALSEIIGHRLVEFVTPEFRAGLEHRVRTLNASTMELICLRKDGSTFPAEVRIRIRQEEGHAIRVTAVRDLTEEKAAAAKIREQRAELEATRRLALVSEISTGIVHQVTQPLTSMGVNLMLATTRLQACRSRSCQSLEIIKEVETDVNRMRDIVTSLRQMGNPAAPPSVSKDLNAIISGVIQQLQSDAETLGINLVVELDERLPLVAIDWVQMSQVAINLMRNAFDACAGCAPERRVVTIQTCMLDSKRVELSVCDTGSGITPDALACLFSPLFTTKPNGLGIGLRFSQTIVQTHGGTISGGNNPSGCGATFRVVLPLAEMSLYTKV